MPKFYLYARKSTDDEDRQVLSIESQINELREYAKKENLDIVDEFTEAKSAKARDDPYFLLCLSKLKLV